MNYKRNRSRTQQGRGSYDKHKFAKLPEHIASFGWLNQWPEYWDILYHRRPKRRQTKLLERRAIFDIYDADAVLWPTGCHRPHKYYW